MLLGLLLELLLESFHIVFNLGALLVIDLVNVGGSRVADPLIQHPCSVQTHHALLELLVRDLVLEQLLLDVVLEVFNHAILPHDLVLHLIGCLGQTFLSHSQIVHDQNQVLIDSIEVFLLRAHLICLFVKFLDLDLLRANVSLQLLDLVVENELKLF